MRLVKWIPIWALAVAACADTEPLGEGALALTTASPDAGLTGSFERDGRRYSFEAAPVSETDRTATLSIDGKVIASVMLHESSFEMTIGGGSVGAAHEGSQVDLDALTVFANSEHGAALHDLVLELEAIGGERPELSKWTGMYSMFVEGMAIATDPALAVCIICHWDGNGHWFCWYCFGS